MTKFEELIDVITRNRNKGKGKQSATIEDEYQELEIEVAGSEKSKAPLGSFASDEQDMDLTDQLYFKVKYKPLMGEFAESWD